MEVVHVCIGACLLSLPAIVTGCSFDGNVRAGLIAPSSDGGPTVVVADGGANAPDAGSPDASAPDAQVPPACLTDPSYIERANSDHRYHYEGSGLFYDQAHSFCANTGGHLVVIDDSAENDFVAGLGGAPWIGLNDYEVENSFSWVTGSSSSFTNWASGEPNDSGGDEDCALTQGGTWNDGECSNQREFVCECDPMFKSPPPPTCMDSATYAEIYQGRRYRYESTATNYAAAEASCASEGGHLVVVTDIAENDYVRNMISETSWIGYSDAVSENSFAWVTGSASSYTNWSGGQPDNSNEEDCVESNTNGDWNDQGCESNRAFVCECDPFVTLNTLATN